MTNRARFISITLALVFAGAAGAATSSEPRNLSLLKEEIVRYVDSGSYEEEIAAVAKEASAWIEQRVKTAGSIPAGQSPARLAVVFDIDETMLSNLPHIRAQDFGYQAGAWNVWIARGEAPVIEQVREIYRTVRKLGVAVIFITGRRENDRAGTEKNLHAAEVGDYAALLLKPDADQGTTALFKAGARRKLTTDGYVIIANIGDQEGDFAGGYAEKTFKLPDPFYITK